MHWSGGPIAAVLVCAGVAVIACGLVTAVALLGSRVRRLRRRFESDTDALRQVNDRLAADRSAERAELSRLLTESRLHDELTGLASRPALLARLTAALEAGERGALLLVDVDRFREINEELGHGRGDEVLIAIASNLRGVVRPGELVARMGGDEFAVLFPDLRVIHVQPLLDRVLAAASTVVDIHGRSAVVHSSLGVVFTSPGSSPSTVLAKADMAMRAAKAAGGGQMRSYADLMGELIAERRSLEADLAEAVARDQLRLVYQPLVDLDDGSLIGFEALLRWTHAERGSVSPEVFIPVAEDTGLIDRIGDWVLGQSLAQLRTWQLDGNPKLVMSINVSTHQLHNPALPERISRLMHESSVDPATVLLEITESRAMDEGSPALTTLRELKALGLRLALDDFGTGHSSLARLAQMPIDKVKIDKSFVTPLHVGDPESRRRAVLLRAAIAMSQGLGLRVIAEGAESADHVRLLRALGAHEVQGFYLGRPTPSSALYLPGLRWALPEPDDSLLAELPSMAAASADSSPFGRWPRLAGPAEAAERADDRLPYPPGWPLS